MLPSACLDGVDTPDVIHFRAQYPACACPCHRSTPNLAADGVWLRVGMVRYTFPVRLFHPLHSSRLLALSQDSFRPPRRSCGSKAAHNRSLRTTPVALSLPRTASRMCGPRPITSLDVLES